MQGVVSSFEKNLCVFFTIRRANINKFLEKNVLFIFLLQRFFCENLKYPLYLCILAQEAFIQGVVFPNFVWHIVLSILSRTFTASRV